MAKSSKKLQRLKKGYPLSTGETPKEQPETYGSKLGKAVSDLTKSKKKKRAYGRKKDEAARDKYYKRGK